MYGSIRLPKEKVIANAKVKNENELELTFVDGTSKVIEVEYLKRKDRTDKIYKIDLQPMRRKTTPHYTNHLENYISFNQSAWLLWGRYPATITNQKTGKSKIINEKMTLEDVVKIKKELE